MGKQKQKFYKPLILTNNFTIDGRNLPPPESQQTFGSSSRGSWRREQSGHGSRPSVSSVARIERHAEQVPDLVRGRSIAGHWKKTGQPVKFEMTEQTREAIDSNIGAARKKPGEFLFSGRRGRHQPITARHTQFDLAHTLPTTSERNTSSLPCRAMRRLAAWRHVVHSRHQSVYLAPSLRVHAARVAKE